MLRKSKITMLGIEIRQLPGLMRKTKFPVILTILLCLASQLTLADRTRVLYIGGVELPTGGAGGAFWHLENDPFFELTPVRAMWLPGDYGYDDDVMARAMRQYMPRTYQELLDNYDIVSLFYASKEVVKAEFIKWISDAVADGKGMVFMGHGSSWAFDWSATTVGDILPVEMLKSDYTKQPTRIKITQENHPINVGLPWSSIGEHGYLAGHSFVQSRTGSEVLATLLPPFGPAYPFIVGWQIEAGRSMAIMSVFRYENNPFGEWEFFPDLISNIHLYQANQVIPDNPEVLHRIRRDLGTYALRNGVLVSTIEFISQLGGDTSEIDRIIDQANSRLKEVEELYLAYGFDAALELVKGNIQDLERAEEVAMKVKDRTFTWIYTVEWLVLTSTSIITGVMIWSLMIRKRLYSDVSTTRLTRALIESHKTLGGDTG
jgi:uncharacterized membrane protein